MEATREEPVSPTGRLLLQPQFNLTINCALSLKNPIDIEVVKTEMRNFDMAKHPRFSSLLVVDKQGKEFWRKTQVNLDDHLIIHHFNPPLDSEFDQVQEETINSFLADFAVSSPLSTDKPLWELHVVMELNIIILRIHHSLGDGVSLISLVLATFKRLNGKNVDDDDENKKAVNVAEKNRGERKWREKGMIGLMKMIWFTIIAVIGFIGRSLWIKDVNTGISGGDGVELWPRMAATAKFSLEDMKIVKRAIPNATINDVLFGVISSGLSKYLDIRSSHAMPEGLQLTGTSMVNLRKQPGPQELSKLMEDDGSQGRLNNQIGMILLPVFCHAKKPKTTNPLDFVRRAKVMLDQKKQSLEAHSSYTIGYYILSLLGIKAASKIYYKLICNTTFMISNVIGPQEEMALADNPITSFRAATSTFAHALLMVMVSYAGMANLQILVAKDIIPDPGFLAKCFEDALFEMKNAAAMLSSTHS